MSLEKLGTKFAFIDAPPSSYCNYRPYSGWQLGQAHPRWVWKGLSCEVTKWPHEEATCVWPLFILSVIFTPISRGRFHDCHFFHFLLRIRSNFT